MKKIKTNKGIAPIVLLIIVMLAAGGIAAVVKTRSNKNILKESLSEQTSENNENDTTATKAKSLSPTGIAQKAYTVKLSEENSSRQSGEAVITDAGTAVKVVVSLSGMTNSTSMPSHIHTGTCAALGEIKYPLSNVSKGASQTSLNIKISEILNNLPMAIAIHKSAEEMKTILACGTIPESLNPQTKTPAPKNDIVAPVGSPRTVRYTSTGFIPATLEIIRGQNVKFVNDTTLTMWVASNDHPTHTLYPGFDQGRSVGKDGTFNFIFTEPGTWKYHNHNSPSQGGAVIVR